MRKMVLFVIMALMISVSGYAEDTKSESEDSPFQKASDVINGKYEVKTVPLKKVTIFQTMANNIKTLNQK